MRFPQAEDIRKIRKNLDVTQAQLSKASGVSQSTIAKIERGRISASYDTVVKIFDTLEGMKDEGRKDITAADLASKGAVTVQSTDVVHTASNLMKTTGFSQLPVLSGDVPVGSISEKRLFELIREGHTMEEMGHIPIRDVMGDGFPIVTENMPMNSVSAMLENSDAVLVVRKGRLIGMITNADILKLI
jgi:predicted transcriptional regulator